MIFPDDEFPWRSFAACRPDYADRPLDEWVAIFYPQRGESNSEAKAICSECPAIEACREWGIRHEHHGVFGGLSERERRLRRKLAQHTPPIPAA